MLKTDYLLELLRDLESQAANRAKANRLIHTINRDGGAKDLISARKKLGEDPNTEDLPVLYAEIKDAVDAHNAAVIITMPPLQEVADGVDAAESVEA